MFPIKILCKFSKAYTCMQTDSGRRTDELNWFEILHRHTQGICTLYGIWCVFLDVVNWSINLAFSDLSMADIKIEIIDVINGIIKPLGSSMYKEICLRSIMLTSKYPYIELKYYAIPFRLYGRLSQLVRRRTYSDWL